MRTLFLFILLNLYYVGYCAPPKTAKPNAMEQQIADIQQQQAVQTQQIAGLQTRMHSFDDSEKEHRVKEAVFGDLITMHATWFVVVVGILAGIFGLIGWRKYTHVEEQMQTTVTQLKTQLNEVIRAHKEDEAKVFRKIEEDRILLKKDLSNLYSAVLNDVDGIKRSNAIFLYILQFRNNLYEVDFYDNLTDENKRKIQDGDFVSVLFSRTKALEKTIDKLIADDQPLEHPDIAEAVKLFANLRLTDNMPRKDEFEALRRRIVVKLEDYYAKKPKKAKSA